jgi:hypothetical protein
VLSNPEKRSIEELELGKSERLEQYLAFAARFHHYSVNSQTLIYMQRPNAAFVAGYRTWQEMEYHDAGSEKAIRILAPRPYQSSQFCQWIEP